MLVLLKLGTSLGATPVCYPVQRSTFRCQDHEAGSKWREWRSGEGIWWGEPPDDDQEFLGHWIAIWKHVYHWVCNRESVKQFVRFLRRFEG